MEDSAECMLVLIGATPEGKKELVGFQTGVRESAQSWRELLIDISGVGPRSRRTLRSATVRSASGRRDLVQHVGSLVNPTALVPGARKDLFDRPQ
jgi:transposase-like protein